MIPCLIHVYNMHNMHFHVEYELTLSKTITPPKLFSLYFERFSTSFRVFERTDPLSKTITFPKFFSLHFERFSTSFRVFKRTVPLQRR